MDFQPPEASNIVIPDCPPNCLPEPQPPKPKRSMESWVGRNLIAILACVLVFLGLVFLGFLVVPTLGDTAKIALMFSFSGVLSAVALALTLVKKNSFTNALLGCGVGSLLISLMLAHLYFHALGDVYAFVLLTLWLAAALALVRLTSSLLMSIITHVGMVVSLCLAYTIGLNQGNLALILAYHILSVALITVGSHFCYPKALRWGLIASLAMSLVAVSAMFSNYLEASNAITTVQSNLVIAAFVIQLVGAIILSAVVFRAVAKQTSKPLGITIQLINSAILCAIIFVATWLFPLALINLTLYPLATHSWLANLPSLFIPTLITSLVAIGCFFVSLGLGKRHSGSAAYELISTIMLAFYTSGALIMFYITIALQFMDYPYLPGIILVAVLVAIGYQITKRSAYLLASFIFLVIDFGLMLFAGFWTLITNGSVAFGFIYMVVCLALLAYIATRLNSQQKASLQVPLKIAALAIFELSVISTISAAELLSSYSFLIITAAFIVLFAFKFDARNQRQKGFYLFMRIHEIALVAAAALDLLFTHSLDAIPFITTRESILLTNTLAIILSIAGIALLACTVTSLSRTRKQLWLGVPLGIAFTLAVMAPIGVVTTWLNQPSVLSLALMASALVCIAGGFLTGIKPLRLYGLVLVIGSVLKLVTFDISNAQTIVRVVALIVGGLICFGIGALYTYSNKRFGTGVGASSRTATPIPAVAPDTPVAPAPPALTQVPAAPASTVVPAAPVAPAAAVPTASFPAPVPAAPGLGAPAPATPGATLSSVLSYPVAPNPAQNASQVEPTVQYVPEEGSGTEQEAGGLIRHHFSPR